MTAKQAAQYWGRQGGILRTPAQTKARRRNMERLNARRRQRLLNLGGKGA